MAGTRAELEQIKDILINQAQNNIRAQTKSMIDAQKMATYMKHKTEQAHLDSEDIKRADDLWQKILSESKKIANEPMRGYDSFTSMMSVLGHLAAELNLAIQADKPIASLFQSIKEYVYPSTDVQVLDANDLARIQQAVARYQEQLNNGTITLPEIGYTGTQGDYKLVLPESLVLDEAEKLEVNNLFNRYMERNNPQTLENDSQALGLNFHTRVTPQPTLNRR